MESNTLDDDLFGGTSLAALADSVGSKDAALIASRALAIVLSAEAEAVPRICSAIHNAMITALGSKGTALGIVALGTVLASTLATYAKYERESKGVDLAAQALGAWLDAAIEAALEPGTPLGDL